MTAPVKSPASRTREWDGVRVLLIFIVSWYHIWQQSWLTPHIGNVSLDFMVRAGYMPVDGTVFLSGFLLFLPYASAHRSGALLPAIRPFYRRRLARIVPSYYFVTLLTLFAVVFPWHLYTSPQEAFEDIFTHLTFTFTFFHRPYLACKISGASWTILIEMQMYLIFPFLARLILKRPVQTILGMFGICFAFRAWCFWSQSSYGMVVNQLPNFLDLYAIAIMTAYVNTVAREQYAQARRPWIWQLLATLLVAVSIWGFIVVLQGQALSNGMEELQGGQMIRRPLVAICMAGIVGGLPMAIWPVRKLFGNPVMTFLSTISMNYYLTHQTLAVHLKRLHIPDYVNELPNQAGEQPWQDQYTLLCFVLGLLLAILITYGVEKPCAKWMLNRFAKHDAWLKEHPERRILP